MSNYLQLGVLFLAAASLASATDHLALATSVSSFDMSSGTQRDALRVNGNPEALPTFTVEAGKTVQLSFEVYREEGVFEKFEYILGVRGMDAPGLDPSLGSDWEYRSGKTFPYVLNDVHKNPHTFTLEVAVDLSVPADLYRMGAIVTGLDERKDSHPWNWFDDSWDKLFPKTSASWPSWTLPVIPEIFDFPEWTFGSFGMTDTKLDSFFQTEVKWFDLQPFNLRVTSPAVPEPSTFVLLFTLAVGLSQMRIQPSRRMFMPR
jgi:hypothetical protein